MAWFDPEPRLKSERWSQLERSLAQVERVRGSRTEGPEWLLGAMEAAARRLRRHEDAGGDPLGLKRPASLGYFVVIFRGVARSMRRDWKRRRKGPGRGLGGGPPTRRRAIGAEPTGRCPPLRGADPVPAPSVALMAAGRPGAVLRRTASSGPCVASPT
jgi:hypothetical protein